MQIENKPIGTKDPVRSSPNPVYRLFHKDYPENFAAYSPVANHFYDLVRADMPADWNIQRKNIWFYCSPNQLRLPRQGWKIHVSATLQNSREVLRKVASRLYKYQDVAFKFALDQSLLLLLNSKTWPRSGSGKFITIYPPDSRRFLEIIEEIYAATAGMRGPYILSDQRYKSSRVVFYRYGGIRPLMLLNVKGEKVPMLRGPDGSTVPDQRLAFPVLPSWEKPVLPVETSDNKKDGPLKLLNGRYTIEKAVAFSSAGGVYYAHDNQTGRKVVVKEARPCINATADDYDAIELLKKEHRLLTVVADTGIAPQPIDLFQEWEHWFLVEEFIEGTSLPSHSSANSVLLRTRPAARDYDDWCAGFSRLCVNLVRIVKILHSRKIVFADLSPNNLIVAADGHELKIIDFEGAHQVGTDRAVNIFTPGFVSQHRTAGDQATWQDDYYAAGAVLLAYLLPINGVLHLNPLARHEFIASIRRDIHLPKSIADLINNLMDHPESFCSKPVSNVEVVRSSSATPSDSAIQTPSYDYQAVLNDIVIHLQGVAEYERNDRVYPADPRVFSTNPLSLAYGATGVVYALHRITGRVPDASMDWILKRKITASEYAPGLYVGMSGIAWALLDIGMQEKAEEIFRTTFHHPLLHSSADLFHGMAGWGMTALRFFSTTKNELYLQQAKKAGDTLLASCTTSERGCCWTASDDCALGLAHGSSGIALFLLYLYLASKDERYLASGLCALDFDLAAAVPTKDGGLSWSESVKSASPLYPYWRFGSAGVGIVTARFQRLIGSPGYKSILEQIFVDTDRKYAVFPGRFTGLAGLGDFLLDMHDLTGEQRFLRSANNIAETIMHFRIVRNGSAFPGELLSRLCCDYGTGSAGVALFLNRLLGHQQSDFLLDGLFPSPKREVSSEKQVYTGSAAAGIAG